MICNKKHRYLSEYEVFLMLKITIMVIDIFVQDVLMKKG